MSFLDTLRQWDEAATCADRQDFTEALRIFLSIKEPNSKIYFNTGCLHLLNQDLEDAEKVWLNTNHDIQETYVCCFEEKKKQKKVKSLV